MENQVNTVDLDRICRLCLEDKNYETFHHIFDENLNNKIIILSGLEVCLILNNKIQNKFSKIVLIIYFFRFLKLIFFLRKYVGTVVIN